MDWSNGFQMVEIGKGKVVDVLTPKYDVIARFQGGPNAGHTLEFVNGSPIISLSSGFSSGNPHKKIFGKFS